MGPKVIRMSASKTPKSATPALNIGMISHTEIASIDPEATCRFLEKVVGWTFQPSSLSGPTYRTFRATAGTGGGVRRTEPEESPACTPYVEVESLDDTEAQALKAGGRIVLPKTDVGGSGWIIWVQLPGGPVMGFWETNLEWLARRGAGVTRASTASRPRRRSRSDR